jgi:protein PhnA
MSDTEDIRPETRDSNGNVLVDGDSVHITKDLDVKGSSETLKRGTVIKNIRLTDNPGQIECRIGKGITVLKTEFVKKK